jgi:uncharacterized protein with HEPN domain
MSRREAKLLLNDILDSIEKIRIYVDGYNFESFLADSKTCDAVIRNFEIIGEAANRLPDEIREQYPDINWFRIRGFRNRIVHDYMGIDYSIVWTIIENDLEVFVTGISKILSEI